MNQHNQFVFDFLNRYVELPDPRYAVLLTGGWGCGKTYFVQDWIKKLTNKNKTDRTSTIDNPIYVSLFGLSTIKDINDAVTREIYPFMKSKLYGLGKVALGAVSKVAINCDLGKLSNDKLKGEANLELDLVSLFKTEKKEHEKRVIVFDDLERCKVPMADILGYINQFVEHSNIRTILLCNEDAFEPTPETIDDEKRIERKRDYDSFKEKVVGRTFIVEPEVEDAINWFCGNSGLICLDDFQKRIARDVFIKTCCKNIRLLYQSLQDYSLLMGKITYDAEDGRQLKIVNGILMQYVVAYCEYANNKEVKSMAEKTPSPINLLNFNVLAGNDVEGEKANLLSKYADMSSDAPSGDIFNHPMQWILSSLKYGINIADVVQKLLNQKEEEKTISQKISQYFLLENSEFNTLYQEAIDYIRSTDSDILEIVNTVVTLLEIDKRKVRKLDESILDESKSSIQYILGKSIDIEYINNLMDRFTTTIKGGLGIDFDARTQKYIEDVDSLLGNRYEELKNDEIVLLETIQDSNFDEIIERFFQKIGDIKVCRYAILPIFNQINPQSFAQSLLALTNSHKLEFGNRLIGRYELEPPKGLTETYKFELENLSKIREDIEKAAATKELIDKMAIKKLVQRFDKIILAINSNQMSLI